LTRIGGYINIVLISGAVPLVLLGVAGFNLAPFVSLACVIFSGWWGLQLFVPGDEELSRNVADLGTQGRETDRKQKALSAELPRVLTELAQAEENYRRAYDVFNSRINRLRLANWPDMKGEEFESFLGDVFLEYDYSVQTTKVTGDQGVDLLLQKGDRRIAIQAKGYPRSTVGNLAIQEVHAGMIFYGCNQSIVITNSTFTSSARQLASSVGCQLIDREQIPLLIEGKLRV
jgi:restriction endonuclease Mrr